MPKIVDHDVRRTEVLDATWRVIGRYGLEGATVRRIADEAGYSNGILTHYFKNKEDILISAHQLAFSRAGSRIDRVRTRFTGLPAVRLAVFEALPLDAERILEAQVDVSFLGYTVGNERLRQIRRASNEEVRRNWTQIVEAAMHVGALDADDSSADIADELMALIDSLSLEAIIQPDWMTPDRQRHLVDRYLRRIATDPTNLSN